MMMRSRRRREFLLLLLMVEMICVGRAVSAGWRRWR
jgi:hypothetical protein